MNSTQLIKLGTPHMQEILDADIAFNESFALADSTHKQDDRAYVHQVVNEDPQTCASVPYIWEYTMRKPRGNEGTEFETVVDADEAFEIVQRRNNSLRR